MTRCLDRNSGWFTEGIFLAGTSLWDKSPRACANLKNLLCVIKSCSSRRPSVSKDNGSAIIDNVRSISLIYIYIFHHFCECVLRYFSVVTLCCKQAVPWLVGSSY